MSCFKKIQWKLSYYRSSRSEVFCWKDVLKICSKLTEEHPCRSAISIKLLSNFIEIALRHGCSPVNLLHIFQNTFSQEHLWAATSAARCMEVLLFIESPEKRLQDVYSSSKDIISLQKSDKINLLTPLSTKRSYIIKQTCFFQLQICLSMYNILLDTIKLLIFCGIL